MPRAAIWYPDEHYLGLCAKVSSSARKICAAIKKCLDQAGRDKVIQIQVSQFAPTTEGR